MGRLSENASSQSTALWSQGKDGTYEISQDAYRETTSYYDTADFQETAATFSSGAWVGGEYWSASISAANESYSAPYAPIIRTALPLLSYPAASPTGLGK